MSHGDREVESRRQLADLDANRLESAKSLIDTLRTPLETQQVYDCLRAGFHREQPVPALEATDEHLHARLVLAGLRVDPAIAQSFGGNLADEVFGRSPESLRNSRGLELHRELGAGRPNREVFDPHVKWVAFSLQAGFPVGRNLGRRVSVAVLQTGSPSAMAQTGQ